MDQLPIDIHAYIMRMYFTHHVLPELARIDCTSRRTNVTVGQFVDMLNARIQTETATSQPNLKVLKRLRYARDRWSNHVYHIRENVTSVV
jgi:hypothetical protein